MTTCSSCGPLRSAAREAGHPERVRQRVSALGSSARRLSLGWLHRGLPRDGSDATNGGASDHELGCVERFPIRLGTESWHHLAFVSSLLGTRMGIRAVPLRKACSLSLFERGPWYGKPMATKAQAYRTQQQRDANPPKEKRSPRPRRDEPVDTAQPGVSASDRKVGAGHSGTRNVSKRAGRKGGARLEDSATGKASRKSTRSSSGRAKRTSNLERKAIREAASPAARSAKATARGKVR